MPTTKLRKPVAPVVEEEIEDDEEELEEEEVKPVRRPKAKTAAAPAKAATNGAVKTSKAAAPAQSARFYVTQVLITGAPQDEVKKRAMALAKKDGSPASFKTFNVPYFINYLVETKGYRKREANGTIRLVAPKA